MKILKLKLTPNPYGNVKVYGPYTRKDNRQVVILMGGNVGKRTVSYPKYLMEVKLGRKLDPNLETIDHIDRNFLNNNFSNLRIVPLSKNASDDALRVKLIEVTCISCSKKMLRKARNVDHNAKLRTAGPFCKSCAGKYGTDIQNSRINSRPPQPQIPKSSRIYYRNTK